jgi:hypothetical protein
MFDDNLLLWACEPDEAAHENAAKIDNFFLGW